LAEFLDRIEARYGKADRVWLMDRGARPVVGQDVTFRVLEGEGWVREATVVSDSAGFAATYWTVGTLGAQVLEARATSPDGTGPFARFTATDVGRLLQDPGIVRNRLKVEATISNAQAYLQVVQEFDSFAAYIWGFTGGRTVQNRWRSLAELPAETAESRRMSQDLRKRGFRFVGPTICYAFMQAVGLVNDHVVGCFRYRELTHE